MILLPLLSLTKLTINSTTQNSIVTSLSQLYSTLENIPSSIFSSALGNYIFFPISTLLQPLEASGTSITRGDNVLELTYKVLTLLIEKWRKSSGGIGMEIRILHEFWIMSILSLGGPLDVSKPSTGNSKGKGKMVEKSDELKLAILEVLVALISPVELEDQVVEEVQDDSDDDFMAENIDWTADEPFPPSQLNPPSSSPTLPSTPIPNPISPPIPILFHTLTTLLDLASTPTSLIALQSVSLEALISLLQFHLIPHPLNSTSTSGPSSLLATALPGTASTLSRIVLSLPSTSTTSNGGSSTSKLTITSEQKSVKRQPIKIIISALEVLTLLITSTISDEVTESLRNIELSKGLPSATLEEVFENFSNSSTFDDLPNEEDISLPSPSSPPVFKAPTGPTIPTYAWLNHTISQITVLIRSISTLSTHESPLVRSSLASLFSKVLLDCGDTLSGDEDNSNSGGIRLLLEGLLLLAGDDWIEVSSVAKKGLESYLISNSGSSKIAGRARGGDIISEIIKGKLLSLPSILLRGEETKVITSSKIVRVALELSTSSGQEGGGALVLEGIEKWSWNLLRALGFDRVPGIGEELSKGGIELAWITSSATPTTSSATSSEIEWPRISMKYLKEEKTKSSLIQLFKALGNWSNYNNSENLIIEQFLGIGISAGGLGGEGVSASALWVLDGILNGLDSEKKGIKKVVRNVVRKVLDLLKTLEDDVLGEDASSKSQATQATVPSTSEEISKIEFEELSTLVSVEHSKGLSITPSLDKLKPTSTASTSLVSSNRLVLTALSIRVLATTSNLLGSSFQPHLLLSLYHLLSHSSTTSHPLLRSYSQIALNQIALSTSYASTENLLLSNVDYILNSVSQRLSITSLSPKAPLVLVEMIRLVGKEVVPYIGDLVEDLFESLDDYHGYDEITVGLWGVLDAVVRVLVDELDIKEEFNGKKDKRESEPDEDRDWKKFVDWFQKRKDPIEEEEGIDFGTNPRKPFGDSNTATEEEEGVTESIEGGGFPTTHVPIPPTKSQVLVNQILSKSLYFLSHSSPFLRSRVLSLLSTSVPLLSTRSIEDDPSSSRQSDLLTLVHRSWPFVLNRLSDKESYVVLEAVSYIESLSRNVGEFMGRRILDEVWPKWKLLLDKMNSLEFDNQKAGLVGKFTISHRIQLSVIRTLTVIANSVPMKESLVWEIGLKFRKYFDKRKVDKELIIENRKLYLALGRVNQDAIWLILSGAIGRKGTPEWLKIERDVRESVELVLNELE